MNKKNPEYHTKHKGIKMELYKLNEYYAITISPVDERIHLRKVPNEIKMYEYYQAQYRDIEIVLSHKLFGCKIELYPELSPTGRLHFHGIVRITDIFKFMYHDLHRISELGCYEVDTIEGDDGMAKWLLYCTKQLHIMKPLNDRINANYPLHNNGEVKKRFTENETRISKYLSVENE